MTSIRSFIKKLFRDNAFITVVSGLPRSGTSMMMSALKAGGMKLVVDGIRNPDANNPKGYYEFENVKKLPQGREDWLEAAQGKAVKVISALLEYLPEDYNYQIIFMERKIEEILASQQRMLARTGKNTEMLVADSAMKQSFEKHLFEVKSWLENQNWVETLYVSYNETLHRPVSTFRKVASFLHVDLDPHAMAMVVDPKLYREKK